MLGEFLNSQLTQSPNSILWIWVAVGGVFEQVDEVLADGRAFICGDRFTAADLSFAALGSLIIAPQGYREHFLSALQSPYLLFCNMH